jgi:hypothetical protein
VGWLPAPTKGNAQRYFVHGRETATAITIHRRPRLFADRSVLERVLSRNCPRLVLLLPRRCASVSSLTRSTQALAGTEVSTMSSSRWRLMARGDQRARLSIGSKEIPVARLGTPNSRKAARTSLMGSGGGMNRSADRSDRGFLTSGLSAMMWLENMLYGSPPVPTQGSRHGCDQEKTGAVRRLIKTTHHAHTSHCATCGRVRMRFQS